MTTEGELAARDPVPTAVDDAATLFLDEYAAGRSPSVDEFVARLATEGERERFKRILRFAMTVENFPPTSLLPGQSLGPFVIEEKIHEGPMGVVYRARDTRFTERQVAIKVLPGSRPENDPLVQRLTAEAEVLVGLNHPHIVTVFERGEIGKVRYFVMEWIEGVSLEDTAKRLAKKKAAGTRRLTADDLCEVVGRPLKEGSEPFLHETDDYWMAVARIMRKICLALEAVHDKGILHRDLKPANVMLTDGCVPKVMDFGLAASRHLQSGTVTRQFVGTPPYLAPEQVRQQQVGRDPRSEVYQLGLILYELLTLRRAFPHDSLTHLLHDIALGQFRPPRKVDRNVPSDLETICMVATEPDKDRRYQSAKEMRLELQRFLERIPLIGRRPGLLRRLDLFVQRTRKALAAAWLASLLAAGLAGWWYWDTHVAQAAQCTPFAVRPDGSPEDDAPLAGRVRPGQDLLVQLELARESTILALAMSGPDEGQLGRMWLKALQPLAVDELKTGQRSDKSRVALTLGKGTHRVWLTRVGSPDEESAGKPWTEGLMVFALRTGTHPSIERWFGELARSKERVPADAALRLLAAKSRGESAAELSDTDRARIELLAKQGRFDRKHGLWPLAEPKPFEFYYSLEAPVRVASATAPGAGTVPSTRASSGAGPTPGTGTSPPDGTSPGKGGPRRALLVGITRYRHPEANDDLHDLGGCLNDIDRVRNVLISERFGFVERDVVVLENEAATHRRVVEEFHRHLIQAAEPGMEAVFYWAGHGSQTPDASGRAGVEADARDSTLVAYDSRRKGSDEPFDITDDELHSLLWSLCAKGARATVITDSCHSGGATRGPASPPTRSAPPGRRPVSIDALRAFWPKDVPLLDDDHGKRDERQPWIHIAACRAQDPAYEFVHGAGSSTESHHGALSFFLVEELERMAPGTTFAQLGQRVAARVATQHPFQQVIVTGDQERVVLEGRFGPPLPGFAGRIGKGATGVRVSAGRLHGLRQGSVLEVLGLNGNRLGRARVSSLESVTAQAEWLGKDPQPPDLAVRVKEVERPPGQDPLVVFVPRGETEDLLAAALAARGAGLIQVVREATAAPRYQVFVPGPGSGFELWAIPGDLVLWSGERTEPAAGVPSGERVDKAAETLVARLAEEARYDALMRLGDERGNIPIEVRVDPASNQTVEKYDGKLDGLPSAAVEFRKVAADGDARADSSAEVAIDFPGSSDIVEILVSIPREAAVKPYIAILSVTEYRSAHLLYPGNGDQVPLAPGEVLRVPAHVVIREDKWRLERPMRDRYLVIATERPADFSGYEGDGKLVEKAQSLERSVTRGGDVDPLPQILQQALGGVTRGEGLGGKAAPQKFGVACVDLLVQRVPAEKPKAGGTPGKSGR